MITVRSEVPIYEVEGKDYPDTHSASGERVVVESHRLHGDRVVLVVGGKRVAVISADLKAAIENATNTRRW